MKKSWFIYIEKPIRKVKEAFYFYHKNKVRNSFFSMDNIAFIVLSIACVAFIVLACSIECERIHNIIVALSTAILSSVLIPLALNLAKLCREIKMTIETCNSILNLSIFIFNGLNTNLAQSGKETISDFLNVNSDKLLKQAVLKENAKTIVLFNLIITKANKIKSFDFIKTNDLLDVSIEEFDISVKNNSDWNSMYLNLSKLLRCLKPLFKRTSMFEYFKKKTNKFAKEIKEEYYMFDDECIFQYLENDLSKKETSYIRGEQQ